MLFIIPNLLSKKILKNSQPSFLVEDWVRINSKKASITRKTCTTNLRDLRYALKQKDTTPKERLKIFSITACLFLKVPNLHEFTILLKFTQQTGTSSVCENAKNEFPKKKIPITWKTIS